MITANSSCMDCLFWRSTYREAYQGLCRALPPALGWPVTTADDLCGHWEQSSPGQDAEREGRLDALTAAPKRKRRA